MYHLSRWRKSVTLAVLSAALPATGFSQTITATFNTNAGDFVPGAGGPAGPIWFNEDLTGGTNGAGEIGGNIFVAPDLNLADPSIGPGGVGPGLLTLSNNITGSAEFYVGEASGFTNGAVFLGHMTTASNDGNELGFQISDGGGNQVRFWLGFKSSAQTGGGEPTRGTPHPDINAGQTQSDRITIAGTSAYRVTYNYDSASRILVAEVFNSSNVSQGTCDLTIPGSASASFSAWGIEPAGIQGNIDLRLDNLVYSSGVTPPTPTWLGSGGGAWLTPSNWLAGIVPNAVGAQALLGNAITSSHTVFIDGPVTVASLTINNSNTYVIAGASSLTLQNTGATSALIDVQAGSQKINLPLFFASNTTINIAGGASLTLGNPTTIRANKTVTSNAGLLIQAPLILETGAVLQLNAGLSSFWGAPSLDTGAKVDLKATTLHVDYRGLGSVANAIKGQLTTGYNGGSWNGAGISTSAPLTVNGKLVGLGWKDDTANQQIIVKYTYEGDTDLNGLVDVADLGALATAWQTAGVWSNGDFDYNGTIDVNDLGKLATNWQAGVGNPLGPSFQEALASLGLPTAAVPEPAAVVCMGLVSLISLARRRRAC
jgi:hypothetical protein